MFKSINEKALKRARGQVENEKKQRFVKKQVSKPAQKNIMEDFIPHAPSGSKAAGQEVEILKNILSGSLNSGRPIKKNEPVLPAKGASEAGAGEFVSYKKYTASGRSLASTKVVDLRSYRKPQSKKTFEDAFDDEEVQGKNDFAEDSQKSSGLTSQDSATDLDDDAFFRRIFGDEYDSGTSIEEKIAEQKANAFGTDVQAGSKDLGLNARGDDPFSGNVAFVKTKIPKGGGSKNSRPKKKKIDIDIISGGTDGDII